MKRRACVLAAAALFWPARAAHATGFTDVGEDIVPRAATAVTVGGYMRTRGEDLYNLDLDRGLLPSGQPLYPVPLGDPTGQSLTYADMRLRTDVAVYAPGGTLAVKTRIDVLDNIALGGNAQGIPSASATQLSPPGAMRVKRAYGEALTPIGLLAVGRIGSHWGLGMLTNGGDCADCDSGDAADRAALVTPLAGHIWAVAYDIAQIGPLVTRQDGARLLNLEPAANVHTVTLAMIKWRDEPARRRRTRAGKTTFDYGAYVSHRWQNQDVPATYLPLAQPIAIGAAQVMERGYQATAIDGWARVVHPDFRIETEWAALLGSVDQSSLLPGVLYRHSLTATQWGAAIESDVGPAEGRVSAGLDGGYASGDPSPGVGSFHVDNFRFHPDYRIDRILFREILGTVTGAYYARPHARVDVLRVAPGVLQASVAGVASWAVFPSTTPNDRGPLGVEIDPTLAYASRDGFGLALEYAVLFPLSAFDNPQAHLSAKPAQLGRVRVMYRF